MLILAAASGQVIGGIVTVIVVQLAAVIIAIINHKGVKEAQGNSKVIADQVVNNGGSSLRDAVDRIERKVDLLEETGEERDQRIIDIATEFHGFSRRSNQDRQAIQDQLQGFSNESRTDRQKLWEAIAMLSRWPTHEDRL